jgi:serine/threonine-protein kinase
MLNCAGKITPAFAGGIALPSRYSNFNRIGLGAKSVVLKAHDSFLDRSVAIKFIRPEHNDLNSLLSFQQEAKLLSAFRTLNLPVVLDFGLSQCGRPYMVMELLQGNTLKELLEERGPLGFDLAINISVQILAALEHAHERGVVHRDLKPQNVMITWGDDGKPLAKVVNFGLADGIKNHDLLRGERGKVVRGTPLYMSPEQAQGRQTDSRSDIYSFGCLLFEMLTGATPFAKNSIAETLDAHVRESAPSIRSYMPVGSDMVAELDFIIGKCLRKSPSKRYSSALQLRDALKDLSAQMKVDEAERLRTLIHAVQSAMDAAVERKSETSAGCDLHLTPRLPVIRFVLAAVMLAVISLLGMFSSAIEVFTTPAAESAQL